MNNTRKKYTSSYFKLEKTIRELEQNIQLVMKIQSIDAKQRKNQYDELVKNGFSKEQAIELIK